MDRYHQELEEHFKRLSTRDDFWKFPPMPSFKEFFQPWRNMIEDLEHQVGGSTTVERDENKYQVIVDVQQFAPEEITVRTDDKSIPSRVNTKRKRINMVTCQDISCADTCYHKDTISATLNRVCRPMVFSLSLLRDSLYQHLEKESYQSNEVTR